MKRFFSLLAAVLSILGVSAQTDVSTVLPLDPLVKTGTLPNGMKYYIRRNARPEKRAEFRLAVNAGSTAENDDQRGLAHVVEHMAFNGTRNFKKSEIVDYLESVGTKFGAHLNAYTSFDETVYMLQLPTDKNEIVDKGLQILEDWAHNLSFDSMEVEKERGVVVEEWRLGQGADERMRRKYWPVLFHDSRYENRLPIGKKEIIEGCKQSTLRNFYFDWYRPDLMAVIAVGDFDVNEMEQKIIRQFSNVPVKDNARKLQVWPVPDDTALSVALVKDREARMAQIQLIYKQPVEKSVTVGDYKRMIAQQLFTGMLDARLDELRRSADPPFVYAGSSYGDLVRNKNAYFGYAGAKEDGIERALNTLLEENERVRRFGFTATELERQKADMMSSMEKSFNEREKTESRNFAQEYVSNFLSGEPAPGIAYEYEIYKAQLGSITLEDVNGFAKKWLSNTSNCVVIVTAPDRPTLVMPSEERIRQLVNGMTASAIKPYQDNFIDKPLVDDSKIKAGKVEAARTIDSLGITEWRLSNGARVWLKPTDFKNEIIFNCYRWGGSSQYPDKDYLSTVMGDDIVQVSGLGEFDATSLQKALSGKIVDAAPYITELQHGMNASCAPSDIESMLRLVYKSFMEPRKDTAAFRSLMTNQSASIKNRGADPQSVFMDTISYAMSGYNFHSRPLTPELLKEVDLDRALKSYKELFADPAGFTYVLVGNFNPDEVKPLIEKYLGSLPALHTSMMWHDAGIAAPKGKFERTVLKGTEPKSAVMMRFNMPFEYSRTHRNEVTALTKLMNIRLREVLREEKSGVYGVSCSATPRHYPRPNLELVIYFSCAPQNVEMLTAAAMDVIKEVKEKGCDEKNLVKIKETAIRERETGLKENQFWMSYITSTLQNTENLSDVLHYNEWVNSITTADMKSYANTYLQTANYSKFVLNPEK